MTTGPSHTSALAWAAFGLAISLTSLLCLFPISSYDVWWHLRTGQLILEERSIPRIDLFSYTASGRLWVTHEWLAEVWLHLVHRLGGVDLLVIAKAVLGGLAVGLGAMAGVVGAGAWRRVPAAALGALVAGPLMATRAFARPHMFTALFLGLTLLLLALHTKTGQRRWRLLLIPLFVVWANLHSGFVLGLGLVGLYWLGEWLSSRRDPVTPPAPWWRYGMWFGLLVLVTLANPHHVEALLYPIRLVSNPDVVGNIKELRSIFDPAFRGAFYLKALAVGTIALLALLVVSRHRLQWQLILPGILFYALALRTVRGVTELAVILPALIAAHGATLGSRRGAATLTSALVILLTVSGGMAAVRWGQPMGHDSSRRVGLGVDPRRQPDAVTTFIKQTGPHGRVFNIMAFGGYFIHELWPTHQVYVDGRLDVFPEGFIGDYTVLMASGAGWDEVVERYDITLAALDYRDEPGRDQGLRRRLRDDPEWVCVYFGDNVLLYAREVPENARLLATYGSEFDPSLRSMESIHAFVASASADDLAETIVAIGRMGQMTPDQVAPRTVLVHLLFAAGRPADAVEPLREVLVLDPTSLQHRLYLAQALRQTDALDEARREVAEVLRVEPRSTSALMLLADIERAAGRRPQAAEALTRAAALEPTNSVVQRRLGMLAAEGGDLESARRYFERALSLRPGDPGTLRDLQRLRELEDQR